MPSGKGIQQPRFGGWYSYREWAYHNFTPKSAADQPAAADSVKAPSAIAPRQGVAPGLPPGLTPPDRDDKQTPVHQPSDVIEGTVHDLYPLPPSPAWTDKPLIRPYILTKGRTRPRHELAVDTLILTTGKARAAAGRLLTEHEAIRRFCDTAQSVAEVASMLEIPLGVARIVIDDMEQEGLIQIIVPDLDRMQSVEVLTHVLQGLQKL